MPRAALTTSFLCLLLFLALATHPCFSAPIATSSPSEASRSTTAGSLRFNTVRPSDSPFGKGCVGTSSLCSLALSRAEETESRTLRRERPPQLWRVPEDEDFARRLAQADPDARLRQYYQRLGGEDYERKREMSQEELLRLMHGYEEEGQRKRLERARALQQVLAGQKNQKLSLSRLLDFIKSAHSPYIALSKLFNATRSPRKSSAQKAQVTSRTSPTVEPELPHDTSATLTRRGFPHKDKDDHGIKIGRDAPSDGAESVDQTAQTIPEIGAAFSFPAAAAAQERADDERFHEEMRHRFARPWDQDKTETRDSL